MTFVNLSKLGGMRMGPLDVHNLEMSVTEKHVHGYFCVDKYLTHVIKMS